MPPSSHVHRENRAGFQAGGQAEIIQDGINGFIFDHEQPETFAEKLKQILALEIMRFIISACRLNNRWPNGSIMMLCMIRKCRSLIVSVKTGRKKRSFLYPADRAFGQAC